MKARNLLLLVVVLALVCGLAWWAHLGRPPWRRAASSPEGRIGEKLFPDLPVNDIVTISVQSPHRTFAYARPGDTWLASDCHDYPVEFDRVRDFVLALKELKIGQVIHAEGDQLAQLQLLPPTTVSAEPDQLGRLVRLLREDGSEVATLLVGKSRQRAAGPGPGPFPDGRFVSTGGAVFLVGDTMNDIPERAIDWCNRDLGNVSAGDIVSLSVTGPDREAIELLRPAEGGSLTLDKLSKEQEMDTTKVGEIAGAMSYLQLKTVADPALTPAQTGLDKPVLWLARTKDDKEYTVKLGSVAEGDSGRYVSVAAAYEPPPAAKNDEAGKKAGDAGGDEAKKENADRQKELAEEVRKVNERHGKWVYTVDSQDADAFLLLRAALVKKKEAKKDD